MHSDLIGKIEKARRYAEEPERISLGELKATFRGGNNDHTITLTNDEWTCDCDFFRLRHTCAHVMALQKIMSPMLSSEARTYGQTLEETQLVSAALS
jgi:hypothetical protein